VLDSAEASQWKATTAGSVVALHQKAMAVDPASAQDEIVVAGSAEVLLREAQMGRTVQAGRPVLRP